MKKNVLLLSMCAGMLLFASCASKKDLQNCQLENKELQKNNESVKDQLSDTRQQLAAANARVTSLSDQLEQQKKDYAALQQSLDKSLTNAGSNNINISKLVDQINESNQYIRHLVEVKSKSDSLNMVLTNNLTRSLSKEEMKEVDVQVRKGGVYISLADNMLYKSGSYEINDRAAETLSKIAKIIRRSSGGLDCVKALGIMLEDRNIAQVSINMTDFTRTPLYRVLEMVRFEAARYGVQVIGTEIIGLTPMRALVDCAEYYLQIENFNADKQVLENYIQ